MNETPFFLQVDGRVVPGVLWAPATLRPPVPLLLAGHGGGFGFGGSKRHDSIVNLAVALARNYGVATVAIDQPGCGDRCIHWRKHRRGDRGELCVLGGPCEARFDFGVAPIALCDAPEPRGDVGEAIEQFDVFWIRREHFRDGGLLGRCKRHIFGGLLTAEPDDGLIIGQVDRAGANVVVLARAEPECRAIGGCQSINCGHGRVRPREFNGTEEACGNVGLVSRVRYGESSFLSKPAKFVTQIRSGIDRMR